MDKVRNQLDDNKLISGLTSHDNLLSNLSANCIPEDIMNMDISDYSSFLEKRRSLMAQKIKAYYFSL